MSDLVKRLCSDVQTPDCDCERCVLFREAADRIEQLEREAAENKRDAARWQAIKPYFRVMSPDIDGRHYWTLRGGLPRGANMDEVADAAIAAMKETK